MRYVFLVYGDERQLEAMPASELEALGKDCLANDQALRKSGHLLATAGLQSSRAATTVRVQHGKLSVTIGPFAATNKQLIEIFTIDARDLNQAIRLASTMPQAREGSIEVRPIMESEHLGLRHCWEFEG